MTWPVFEGVIEDRSNHRVVMDLDIEGVDERADLRFSDGSQGIP